VLSVFSTLKETLFLWVRNFWFLAALTPFAAVPFILVGYLESFPPQSYDAARIVLLFVVTCIEYFCEVMITVAVLGLLKNQSLGKTAWAPDWRTIETYSWPLIRLFILIALMIILFGTAVVVIGMGLGLPKGIVLAVFAFLSVLICIKFGLAAPLAVGETLSAVDSLRQSWELSNRHFWYLAGCLFFLALGDGVFYVGTTWPLQGLFWGAVLVAFVTKLLGMMWSILTWCMYLRIKKADAPAIPEAVAN